MSESNNSIRFFMKGEIMVRAVGIDLGTTFSAIAIVHEDGKARVIPNAEGMPTTPSVATWQGNTFLVGQPALQLVQQSASQERQRLNASLVRSVKRMVGNPPQGGIVSNGYRTNPIEVSAAILAKLARDASSHLGFSVRDAVITVPAHFGDRERNATKAAAEMAGLHVLQIVNEPSAAALTYSHGHTTAQGIVLVFDLGGGTFDASVLALNGREMRVIATQGIEELGGVNFTNRLAEELQKRYLAATKITYPQDNTSLDQLTIAAEQAKCTLSSELEATVQLTPSTGTSVSLAITRKEFERLIRLDIFKVKVAVEMALERAQKSPQQIDRVLLCGGSSRIPIIQQMLADLFGRAPEHTLDLDLSVALGAAYQASYCEQETMATALQAMPQPQVGILMDCVSYAVGIAVLDARGTQLTKMVMLHSGDALGQWSFPFSVRLAQAGTNFPPIGVYKGEGAELRQEDYLGDILLSLPANAQAGMQASIRMQQDTSGLVQILMTLNGNELPGALRRVSE